MKVKGEAVMKSYFNKYFVNQTMKTKAVNTLRFILAVFAGIFWLVPGFLEREI